MKYKKEEYLDVDNLKGDDRISMKELESLGKKTVEKKVSKNKKSFSNKFLRLSKGKKSSSAYSKYLSNKDDDYNLANFRRK